MRKRLVLVLGVLILAGLACNPLAPTTGAAPSGLPSPTPPPIPTRPPITPTTAPTATVPAGQVPPQQQMVIAYGSGRGANLGLFMLGSTGETLAPIDLGDKIVNAVWPAPSPDGTKIAFVAEQSDLLINGIFIYNRIDSSLKQLTQGDGMHPQWSPDGSKIAYTCNTSGSSSNLWTINTDVCVINSDGTGQVNLTTDSARPDSYPHWTPDGHIVFMSSRANSDKGLFSEIFIMNGDGSSVTQLTNDKTAYNAYPSVSPDGTQIAFESNREAGSGPEIYTMGIDGSHPLKVTTDKTWDQMPVWSPDGKVLLFAKGGDDGNIDLYQINLDGSNEFRLTHDSGEDGGYRLGHAWFAHPIAVTTTTREDSPAVKVKPPSGSSAVSNGILFATSTFNCQDCLETGIYFVTFDGANLTKLPITGLYPAWSPDFTRIAYVQDGELWIANADSTQPAQITHAHYGFSSLQWKKDGSSILATCQPYGQFDACLIDPTTGGVNNITQNITIGSGIPFPSWISADRILLGQGILDPLGVLINTVSFTGRPSPDGTRLAGIIRRQLVAMNLDGSAQTQLTTDAPTKGFPIWSPDGNLIIYTVAPGDGRLYLYAVRADGVNGPYKLVARPIGAGPTTRPNTLTSYLGYSWAP